MKRQIVLLLALLCMSQAYSVYDLLLEEWNAFKIEHGKKYDSGVEEKFRMKIYMENRRKIVEHNSRFERGEVGFKLEMNQFGDMLRYEFADAMNGFKMNRSEANANGITFISPANVEVPSEVDWREKGAVTEVKNQGNCGSCWSFSATGSLEGQHFRTTGRLVSLSEQNLIDCSTKNHGCRGGNYNLAFLYIEENGGIDTEASYPYEGKEDNCRYSPSSIGATDKGFSILPEGNELTLQEAVAVLGPIAVAIDANHESFMYYSKGIYYEPDCEPRNLDHAVLVVGYGSEDGEDYWLVKNSWSTKWGDEGYIKMARNRNNNCGIATYASYPVV